MNRRSVVTVCQGLPASGKSTWAREVAEATGAYRLNLDDYRAMLGFPSGSDQWTAAKETVAQKLLVSALVSLVESGRDVILDNTHVTPSLPLRYREALAWKNVEWGVKSFMGVDPMECVYRDSLRGGDAYVGSAVIKRLQSNYERENAKGWVLTPEWLAEPGRGFEPYVAPDGLEEAVIVDIDGTLAHMVARGPYQFERVETDALDVLVAEQIRFHRGLGRKILITSGRSDAYREHTKRWLAKFKVSYDELFMRAAGDTRKDDVVKLELFNRHIRDHYNVRLVLDDRNRVVDMWRDLGLTCWQVAPGNF